MKVYKLIKLVFLSGLVFLVSCTDLMEEPIGVLAPEGIFSSPSDVEAAIMGGYGLIASEQFYGRKMTFTVGLRGDMLGMVATNGNREAIDDFTVDPSNSLLSTLFPRCFQIVSAANFALLGADQISGNESKINALKGEARFIRAFAYYHMVRIFGSLPLINDPVLASSPELVANLPKSSIDEIYQSIIADLEFAKDNLPDAYGVLRTRATKGTAASYLASVYLTLASENNALGSYQQAYDEAKWVIDRAGTFGYSLMPDFADLYKAENYDNMPEHVFAVDFKNGFEEAGVNTDFIGSMFAPANLTDGIESNGALIVRAGWNVVAPPVNVLASWDVRDYRRSVSVNTNAFSVTQVDGAYVPVSFDETTNTWQPKEVVDVAGNTVTVSLPRVETPYVKKYWGSETCGACLVNNAKAETNYPAMRYAEVLLIAAESVAAGASGESVENFINPIRERARNANGVVNDFPANVTSTFTRDEVIEERRLELAFEFKRWYDIKRLGIGSEVFSGENALETKSFNPSRDYLFPIPQLDIDLNPNLLPNNPGY